jgi:hypothetical protein
MAMVHWLVDRIQLPTLEGSVPNLGGVGNWLWRILWGVSLRLHGARQGAHLSRWVLQPKLLLVDRTTTCLDRYDRQSSSCPGRIPGIQFTFLRHRYLLSHRRSASGGLLESAVGRFCRRVLQGIPLALHYFRLGADDHGGGRFHRYHQERLTRPPAAASETPPQKKHIDSPCIYGHALSPRLRLWHRLTIRFK